MHPYLVPLHVAFKQHANAANAKAMSAYMKGHFPFFGIKTPLRRELLKEHIAIHGKPLLEELPSITRSAFSLPEREMHQVALDLMMKAAKKMGPHDLPLVEDLITTKSWWDTVDALAVNVVGVILKRYPKEINTWNAHWMHSNDLWLNRTALLFQLKWKEEIDEKLMFANIDSLATHPDFFIRKAIGWVLREYSSTAPDSVRAFVSSRSLSPLSVREALSKLTE